MTIKRGVTFQREYDAARNPIGWTCGAWGRVGKGRTKRLAHAAFWKILPIEYHAITQRIPEDSHFFNRKNPSGSFLP